MSDQDSMSTQEFNNRFEEAIQVVDGPHPERAVQLLEDLMLEASEFYLTDDQIVIQLRMYMGSALWRSDLDARAVPILEAALEDAIRALGSEINKDSILYRKAKKIKNNCSAIRRDCAYTFTVGSKFQKLTVIHLVDNFKK